MYTVKFCVDFFRSNLAWTEEAFRTVSLIGERVRVKSDGEPYVGKLDRRDCLIAKSRGPFMVIITTNAGGKNVHMDGRTTVLIATDEGGNMGARLYAVVDDASHLLQAA